MHKKESKSRRNFIKKSGMIGTGVFIVPRHVLGGKDFTAPSDQLGLAAIGSGGKGTSDISNAYQNGKNRVVALCDVDPVNAKSAYTTHADVNKYLDYREMLEKEKDIDALTISTPDHNHAKIAYDCMNRGIHVYVQKPLTHTIAEARLLAQTAEKNKIVTQMGNQGGSSIGVPKIQEWIDQNKIGKVHTIYAWTNRPVWPQGINHPSANIAKKPDSLNWDLWLGTAKSKPYSPGLHPFDWRGFWEYGTGALGDIGCHTLDAPYKTLQLGYPSSVECTATNVFKKMWTPEYTPEGCPISSMVTLEYNNSPHNKDGIKLIWMDGGLTPTIPEEIEDEFIISPKYFKDSKKYENILTFINQTSSFYLTNQLCQSNPFKKDVYLNQEWVFKIQSMWTVSQKDNEYNPLHGHGGGRLSAVTWLKIPEYLPDRKNRKNRSDGAITFVGNAQYGHEPNGLCTASFTDYPQVGDFYIFPSPLLHEVYPFRTKDGKGERRSVSMNIDFCNKEEYDNMIKQQNDMEKGIVSGKEGLTRKNRNPWASTGIISK